MGSCCGSSQDVTNSPQKARNIQPQQNNIQGKKQDIFNHQIIDQQKIFVQQVEQRNPRQQCINFIKMLVTGQSDPKRAYQKIKKPYHPGKKGTNSYSAYGVQISYGINLGKMRATQIRKLLQGILDEATIKTLEQAARLKGDQAQNFVAKNHAIQLTKDACDKIFQIQFKNCEQRTKKSFENKQLLKSLNLGSKDLTFQTIPFTIKRNLLALQFFGKNTPALRKNLLPIIQEFKRDKKSEAQLKILQEKILNAFKLDQQKFNNLKKILNKQRQINPPNDRNAINTKKLSQIRKNRQNGIKNNNIGGVDLGFNIENTFFDGYFLGNQLIKLHKGGSLDASLKDMIVPLKILFDDKIKAKNISISIDPLVLTDPDGPQQQKIYYPPQMQRTYYAQVMIQADLIMKQLKMGVDTQGRSFVYPQSLKKIGLDFQSILKLREPGIGQQRTRQWIVIRDVEMIKVTDKQVRIGRIKMGIQARNQQIGEDGKLRDTVKQPSRATKRFCQLFTNHYDLIAEQYEAFKILKRLAKASILARSMYLRGCQINMDIVNELFEKEKTDKSSKIIPTLYNNRETRQGNILHILKLTGGCDLYHDVTKYQVEKEQNISTEGSINQQEYQVFYLQSSLACSVQGCQRLCPPQFYQTSNKQCEVHSRMRCIQCFSDIKVGQKYSQVQQGFCHSQCLTCNQCDKCFQGSFVHLQGSEYYHQKCLPQTAIGKCQKCRMDVFSNGQNIQNQLHQFTHITCLQKQKCAQCHKPIVLESVRRIQNKYYHHQCIKCVYCDVVLQQEIMIHNGKWAHSLCIPKTMCVVCGQKILGQFTRVSEKPYHLDCIKCFNCKEVIDGSKGIKFDNQSRFYHPQC